MMNKTLFLTGMTIILYSTVLFGLTGPAAPMPPMAQPMPAAGIQPAMTPEDQQAMEELQKFAKGFDEYRNSLSDEEKEKLDKEVNETANRMQSRMDEMIKSDPTLEERLNKQDPEALDLFFQNVFGPEIERVEAEQAKQQPAAIPAEAGPSTPVEAGPSAPEQAEEKPAPTKLKKADIDTALELIRSIIEYLESFKEKASTGIKFPGYYDKWAQEGRLKGWTKALTWEKFTEKLELLIEKLHELERKDPETKQYTHLADLIENEILFQELKEFNDDLSDNEPRIVVPEAGIGELNSASKDATRETINLCLTGITKIQTELTALIGKYEKTAKKISEEKEKLRQQAEKEAQKRKPGYVHAIGTEDTGYAPYYPEIVGPYAPYSPWESPAAQAKKPTPSETEKPEQKKEEGKKAGGDRKEEKKKSEEETAADRALDEVTGAIVEINYAIEDNARLQKFGEYIANSKEEYDPTVAEALNTIQQQLQAATKTLRRVSTVWIPRLDQSKKGEFIASINNLINKDEQSAPLRKLISDIEGVEKSRGSVTKSKQYGFFDDKTRAAFGEAQAAANEAASAAAVNRNAPEPKPKDEFKDVKAPASIFALRADFERLKETIEHLKTIKQKVAPKKAAAGSATREMRSRPATEAAAE